MASEQDTHAALSVIWGLICLCVLVLGIFYFVNRAKDCEAAGGTYKAMENRCVVDLSEVEIPL